MKQYYLFFKVWGSLILLAGIIHLAGCAIFQGRPEPRVMAVGDSGGQVITFPSEYRGAYVFRRAKADFSGTIVCAEPPPDVAQNLTQSLNATGKFSESTGQSLDAGLTGSASSQDMELSGRTQLILLARELLFRSCEMAMNYPDGKLPDSVKDQYSKILELISNLSQAELKDAQARNLEAQVDLAKLIGSKQVETNKIIDNFIDSKTNSFDNTAWQTYVDKNTDSKIENYKDALKAHTTKDALSKYLLGLPKEVLDAIYADINTPQAN
jgi:hypothetical protein